MGEMLDYLRQNNLIKRRKDYPYLEGHDKYISPCHCFGFVETPKTRFFDWIEPEDADQFCFNCLWHRNITPKGGGVLSFTCANPHIKDKTLIYDQERMLF